ncbi:MAG: FAD-binding protein, partial [Candidatus Falkowbacteria bacterium]|nr:FAD-binding protein [Candidatus Falkowbacteria bacterium]
MKIEKKIQKNISLAPLTTFKIGGIAKFFIEVKSKEELIEAINWAKSQKIDFFILGGGSNILVNDKKIIDKLIIKINYKKLSIENNLLISGAGADLNRVVQTAIKEKLTSLEWALGIPGTIGGAVRGNASAFKSAMS